MTPADLAKFEQRRRYATLVAMAIEGMATVTDEIIDLHDRILGKLFNAACTISAIAMPLYAAMHLNSLMYSCYGLRPQPRTYSMPLLCCVT